MLPRYANNHLLAYFQHRQLERISRHNGVSAGDHTRASEAFFKIIKKVWTAVKLQSPPDDPLRAALLDLKDAYRECREQPPKPYGPLPSPPKAAPPPKQAAARATQKPTARPVRANPFSLLASDE